MRLETNQVAQTLISLANKYGAEFAEVVVMQNEFSLKRIRRGQLDQPPAAEHWGIDLALVKGKQRKVITLDNPLFAEKRIETTLSQMGLESEHEVCLPSESFEKVPQPPKLSDEKTAQLSDENLLQIAKDVASELAHSNLLLSGKITQGRGEIAYHNTLGTMQHARFTLAAAGLFAFHKDNISISAYASSGGVSIEEIERERMVQELIEKCELQLRKEKIDLFQDKREGEELFLDIIAEPYFFSMLFEWLGFFGFNGLFVERGESFISGKIGEQVTGSKITIVDDPADSRNRGIGMPFDLEGRPRSKTILIENGVAKNAVYDGALAKSWGKSPTGHALPPSARSEGAAPFDLVIEGGTTSVEEMIQTSKEPTLWLTKLHYPGMKHYQTGTMTGMAQHGVFLIENGEVISPVENIRFEERIPEALKRVEAMSESRLVFDPLSLSFPSGVVLPAMKIKKFRFIGSTSRLT